VAGLALLGIGVVAAFAGLTSTTQGDGAVAQAPTSSAGALEPGGQASLPTQPAASPAPDAGTPAPEATPFVPGDAGAAPSAAPQSVPAEPVAPPPVVAAPAPAPAPAGDGSDAGSEDIARGPLRVYNNSRIQGLAARAAADFRNAGWTVADIGSYPGAIIPTSTVYYRPGTEEEAIAQELGRVFGLRVEQRFAGLQSSSPGVIVIVTREYETPGKY
jgi:hypothetical protein